MTRIIAILSAYGLAGVLPILLAFQTFIRTDLPGYPIKYGDLLDFLLTPLIGVGVFALLYVSIPRISDLTTKRRNLYRVLFFAFSVLYIEGHGMHLAANSIGNNVVATTDLRLKDTVFLFDESIGHLLWLGGAIGLALAAIAYQVSYTSQHPMTRRQSWLLLLSGMVYGVTFAITIIEGRSALWAAPIVLGALIVMGFRWIRGERQLSRRPTSLFFLSGFTFLLITLGGWLIAFGGFVEPSALYLQ